MSDGAWQVGGPDNTPTPRTDRAQFAAIPDAGRGSRFVVEADFARQLERELAEARAELSKVKTAPAGASAVLVPREPTDEMLDAGHEAGDFHILHYDGTDKPGTPRYSLRKSWSAMLAAAPAQDHAELVRRLRLLHASKKLRPGVHGQIIGMEAYTIVATGEFLEVLHEAADALEGSKTP